MKQEGGHAFNIGNVARFELHQVRVTNAQSLDMPVKRIARAGEVAI